jgi:hypothetical protein
MIAADRIADGTPLELPFSMKKHFADFFHWRVRNISK